MAATFDYSAWAARYPALAAQIAQPQAEAMFEDSELSLLDNTDSSPVQDEAQRTRFFYMIVAHLATLEIRSAQGGGAGGSMVGNVSSASEGSVSVSVSAYSSADDKGKWWNQTQPGAMYWAAVQPFMRAFYMRGPRIFVDVPYPRTRYP